MGKLKAIAKNYSLGWQTQEATSSSHINNLVDETKHAPPPRQKRPRLIIVSYQK